MGIIREPLNVDFVVENRQLTKEEEKQISSYINSQKKKAKTNSISTSRISKSKQRA
jgi:hypothetical protein